jgi:hypothetical protein
VVIFIIFRELIKKKMETLWNARFFTVTADEVTTIDNGTWASITFYYVEQFGRESTMCVLLHVNEGATANNLTKDQRLL